MNVYERYEMPDGRAGERPLAMLIESAARLIGTHKFVAGVDARDDRGRACPPRSPHARAWCVLGALKACALGLAEYEQARERIGVARAYACVSVDDAVQCLRLAALAAQ